MSRLVDDLLLLARGDGGRRPQREPIDVADCSTTRSAAPAPRSPTGGSTSTRPAPWHVLGDRDQLLRVVRNLITNAAVHTRAGRPIRVRGLARRTLASRSRSPTAARACRRRRPRTCSNGSGAPTSPARAPAAAAGWAWPSSRRSCRRTAARSASTARSSRRQHGHRLAAGARRERRQRADRAPVGAIGTIDAMPPRSPSELDPAVAARLKRDAAGLVAAVVQQYDTGEVLMVGWMDDEALHRTLTTGRATYWSRSRQEYWVKGETSGHAQQ